MSLKLEQVEGMGRVVVATRDFAVGDTVMEEDPLLTWRGDLHAYIEAYTRASKQVQDQVLDLYHPPLGDGCVFVAEFRQDARMVAQRISLTSDSVLKLCAIMKANAHTFIGEEVQYKESPISEKKGSALFSLASKVAHSCLPNVSYSSKTGKLKYWAMRPITTGDQVTFAYINDLWSSPIRERRALLQFSKDFLCQCLRCSAPDDVRALPGCRGCGKLLRPYHGGNVVDEPKWMCADCGVREPTEVKKALAMETKLEAQLKELKQTAVHALHLVDPAMVEQLAAKVSTSLSPTHFLNVRVLQFLATICASHAVQMEQLAALGVRHPFGSPKDLRFQAADAAVRVSSICECVAARCSGGRCEIDHPPCDELTMSMFHAGHDLLEVSAKTGSLTRIVPLLRAVCKYMDFIFANLGPQDPDALKLKRLVDQGLKCTIRTDTPASPGSSRGAKKCKPKEDLVDKMGKGGSSMSLCNACGESGSLRCGRCKTAMYCSPDCQKTDWKEHRKSCGGQ